jgi:uncharacterized protein YbjT (DUF2867 family)
MSQGPIIDEIRRLREEIAARFNYDLHAYCEYLEEQEKASGMKTVSLQPRRVKSDSQESR